MPTAFLTQEGYNKLHNELEYLRGQKREEIANRLRDAMEGGELIENAEYEAAKNEQAFIEGRIKELEMLLATARIVDENEPAEAVRVGAKVVIQEDGGEPESYRIVGAAEADPVQGRISNESPIGKALLDCRVGDVVTVEAPGGSFKVKVLEVK